MKLGLALNAMLLLLCACYLPKDPHLSWETAKTSGLKVGVVETPPFCYREDGVLKGSEIQLLKEFAGKEGMDIRFEVGSETNLVERLKNYEFHVLVGGFKKNTVWAKKAGLTTTYMDKRVMLIPRGENELLRNLETYFLKKYDGLPKNL
jgi:membrane-bound lytic murein transglycosylase MltF